MTKPTRDQILQALDDLEEGKPITAELRHAVNLHLKAEVEAKLDAQANVPHLTAMERKLMVDAWFEALIKSLSEPTKP